MRETESRKLTEKGYFLSKVKSLTVEIVFQSRDRYSVTATFEESTEVSTELSDHELPVPGDDGSRGPRHEVRRRVPLLLVRKGRLYENLRLPRFVQ